MKEFDELMQGAMVGALIQGVLLAIRFTRPSSAYTDYWKKGYVPLPGG